MVHSGKKLQLIVNITIRLGSSVPMQVSDQEIESSQRLLSNFVNVRDCNIEIVSPGQLYLCFGCHPDQFVGHGEEATGWKPDNVVARFVAGMVAEQGRSGAPACGEQTAMHNKLLPPIEEGLDAHALYAGLQHSRQGYVPNCQFMS